MCERFPDLRCVFLEANGGWIVPWLERLDHHFEEFGFDVPGLEHAAVGVLPPAVLDQLRPRRVDARLHRHVAVGAAPTASSGRRTTRTPTPSTPGVTDELAEAIAALTEAQQRRIAGDNAVELYGLS